MQNDDIWLQILRLLRLRDEHGGAYADLDALTKAVQQSELEVRRACDALEADKYLDGDHSLGGDKKPSYAISESGKAYLYDLEHGVGT